MSKPAPRRLPWLLGLAALILFIDRLTKTWVTAHIPLGEAIPVLPGVLRISHWTNEGAAFSIFADSASPACIPRFTGQPNSDALASTLAARSQRVVVDLRNDHTAGPVAPGALEMSSTRHPSPSATKW